VLGTVASNPYAGMAWMHMQFVVGLRRLGHDAYYFETTSTWPYDPVRESKVCDSDYALPYLRKVANDFGLEHYWAYRRSYSDKEWFGLNRTKAEDLLANADVVLNIAGATSLAEQGLKVGRHVYVGTDPVLYELSISEGRELWLLDELDEFVTYGENIGNDGCVIPPLPRLRGKTRQPVVMDYWKPATTTQRRYTTVGNWEQQGFDIVHKGERYYWSKHYEFLKFVDLPSRVTPVIELAIGRGSMSNEHRLLLESQGWLLRDALPLTSDPWTYRDYVCASRGEFTVAKDQNVRLRSGWFSERSACYLAAGRPVITQDTGFGCVLPTGEGLFAFNTVEDIMKAFETIESDYEKHCRAARIIAEDYFKAERVLARLLNDLGL